MLGPLKPFDTTERVDEWDRAARSRSIEFTYMAVSIAVPLGLVLLAALAQLASWSMTTLLHAAMATAHASWRMRWDDEG
ncbi:hypothetical protein [Sphingomonas sp. GM_Shp_1]|uniref:hypothetical protein n=1 Tax=Sphingomonas sp. GM_Shp_1 TaxID=2937381 RepID=UPI00226B908C|nr:hypothetical protein [Sphingomonas sp. GM_Shp_1]